MKGGQLDLFAWATPQPKLKRIGFMRERVDCMIGPHWWFSPYLVIGDGTGAVVPDLKSPISFRFYRFRA
jgi:hypothetical protein